MSRPKGTKNGSRGRYEFLIKRLEELKATPQQTCEIWPYAKATAGYGMVVMPDGKRETVHRIAFHFANGHWPEPLARHICTPKEQRACFNPAHLAEGSETDNKQDMKERGMAHGGSLPGVNHPSVILTEEQVREIRAAYIPRKVTFEALGARYGVSSYTIFDIVKRRSWKHIE
jgi:hypothetical protein